jgi:site-specific recombinase XerD
LLRDWALVNVLYATAARLSQVLSLNRSQVNHGRATTATITGKGRYAHSLHVTTKLKGASTSTKQLCTPLR